MKNLKLLVVAFVAMFGFIACEQHECNDYDHSADLVGTWTCLTDDFAEAIVIKADGSVVSTGYHDSNYWNNIGGNIVIDNGNITLTFEDGNKFEGHFDIIPGMAFSIFKEDGTHLTFNYCKEDLSEEIVGMWVCNDAPAGADNDMAIISYANDGSTTFTGILPNKDGYILNVNTTYNVVGDLMFKKNAVQGTSDSPKYISTRLTYAPNGTAAGDIMVYKHYNGTVETSSSYLRIKQHLELPGMKYDYIKTFVSNVKGVDKDVDVMGYTFNFAKMDGVVLDKMLKTVLFAVEFPDANTIRYSCKYNKFSMEMDAPIVVDGNKITVKMSQRDAAYKDVDLYTFQDQDNSQMHMYMHSTAFVNFFGNMQIAFMSELGQLDKTDANAVKAVFDGIDAAVESINLSLVMTKARK